MPDPDGPTMAANSPDLIVTVTDRSAATGGDPGCSLLTPIELQRRHCATTTLVPGRDARPADLDLPGGEQASRHAHEMVRPGRA